MKNLPPRKPVALANWKMAMTVPEGLAFLREFCPAVAGLAASVRIILCPPYTALYPLSEALADSWIDLGAQDVSAAFGKSHTGAISPQLLANAGCSRNFGSVTGPIDFQAGAEILNIQPAMSLSKPTRTREGRTYCSR